MLSAPMLLAAMLTAVPGTVGYQGRLLNSDGTPKTGNATLTFTIFDDPTASTGNKWTEDQQVAFTDGYYAVQLGTVNTTPALASVLTGGDLYLEIKVGGAALSPRQRIGSVPFAITATNVSGGTVDATSVTTTNLTTTNITASTAVTVGGQQVVVGNDARLTDARAPSAGSTNYLQNQTAGAQSASFNISGSGQVGGTFTATGDIRTNGKFIGAIGSSFDNPAATCAALLAAGNTTSGIYWLKPTGASASFRAYCDQTNEGGGWTLVWSNLRGGRAKPETELQWLSAINTLPRFKGEPSTDLETWQVYTGLKHWTALAPGGKLRYDWATDYGQPLQQRYTANFTLTGANYVLTLSNHAQPIGSVNPGLRDYHSGAPFSTYDKDNDTDVTNCAGVYTNTPFWYKNCWSGSINGGGELSGGYANGAFWTGSSGSWGAANGVGAGNGWIYVK